MSLSIDSLSDPDFHPDLVILGRVYLGQDAPRAGAVLLRHGRVAAIGSEADVRRSANIGTTVIDLRGATITPGLTDAHVHLTAWALAQKRADLGKAASEQAACEQVRVAAQRAPADAWVRGHGWDANRWGSFPTLASLDAVAPRHPVALDSHDIHALWVNSEALRRAGIDARSSDPEGGRIVRDPTTGRPTGVLLESAKRLVEDHFPPVERTEVQEALEEAQHRLHRWGITGVHSVEPNGLADFTTMEQAHLLRLRVLQSVPLSRLDAALELGLRSGFGGDWIRVGGVKMFLDGALGSRTALLREPYEESDDRGVETLPLAEFRDAVQRAAAGGIASTVHAIGDAAVARALEVLGSATNGAAIPHRIEHVQLCPPDLWEAAGQSGIVMSMQPVHLRSDIPAAERHWGRARSRGAYPFGALLRAGATLAFGSDCPVETPDPRQGLYAAVRRTGRESPPCDTWHPEHLISAGAALSAYTEGPAYAAGQAQRRGRIRPGFDADLAVWDIDPLDCEPEALLDMQCLLTVVAGEIVHQQGGG